MSNRIPEVDAYIAEAADFAKPILKKIRQLFHKASPKITESMKWSFPHFEYKGIIGSMAAFKNHAGFGFWKAGLMNTIFPQPPQLDAAYVVSLEPQGYR